MTKEILEGHIIGEYQLSGNSHIELEAVGEAYRWAAVRELCNLSAELVRLRSSDRLFAGQLCSHWIATKTITVADYIRALREFFEFIDDTSVDVPKVWQYTAELISKYLSNIKAYTRLVFLNFI